MKTTILMAIILIVGIILPSICFGVNTVYWEQKTSADFNKGRKENLSITNNGEVLLSPTFKEIGDTTELYFWSLVEDKKGNIFIGTGNNGKILKMDKSGNAQLFFDSPEISIVSLAIHKNNLYAGTAPDGLIYKIPLDNSDNVDIFYRTSGEYVWSLIFDESGNLYAGTGSGGRIYKINPDGQGDVLYDSKENHIMCLLYHQGNIYAGGEENGIIYKIEKDGTTSILYDSPESEIHTIIAQDGILYAASVPRGYLETPVTEPREQNEQGPPPPAPFEGFSGNGSTRSVIYKIEPNGVVIPVWECPESLILSMLFDSDGQIIVGTGSRGKLFKVDPENGDWMELTELQDSQILSMIKSTDNKILMASGNLGHVYEYTSSYNEKGTLESDIYDSKYTSKWGKLIWDGIAPQGTKISFETRVGLSEKPDDLWSDWTPLNTDGMIQNEASRFIQWRATLETKNPKISPILSSVKIATLPINLAPQVSAVSVYTSGQISLEANSNNGQTPPPPTKASDNQNERELGPSLAVAKWKAIDPNNDKIRYYLYFRGDGEENWKLLSKRLTEQEYTWNTQVFPDGFYELKVIAADSTSNPDNIAQTGERVSNKFLVDNTPPEIEKLIAITENGISFLTAIIKDTANEIKEVKYSIDAQKWNQIFPQDNIFDEKNESIKITAEKLSPGEHTIVIKASDCAQNVGVAKKVFRVK